MQNHNRCVELEVRHLKLIEAIAGEGSMTRAAGRLYISQSALSHQLTGLETGLGVRLFRRVPRGMVLTEAGEKLLDCARSVLREIEETSRQVSAPDAAGKGTLRISTECYTCYHWLPSRLKEFQQRFPRVDVEIVVEATRRPVEALVAGEIDLGIVSSQPEQAAISSRVLFEDELIAILSPQHALASRRSLKPADFAGQHLITYSVSPRQLTVFQEFLTPAGILPARISRVDLTEAIVEMVKANLGIAVLARWAVARHLNPATLKAMPLSRRGFHRKWYAATLKSRRPPHYIEAFVDLLATQGVLV
jgi:LysR family transcriptional regulator, regulator for metE and metH